MIRRFLFWLSGKLPCYLINRCSTPYLERYYIGSLGTTTFYLHRFVRRDPRGLFHNHGWKWGLSLVLFGGYEEQRFNGTYESVRLWNWLDGRTYHRTNHLFGFPECWTLFVHGKYDTERKWDFKRDGPGIIQYDEYKTSAKDEPWWVSAPLGKDVERQPL